MTPTRRSNGEGSTPRKRKDGRWQINIQTRNTTTGTPITKTIYGKTRAEVVQKARTYRRQLEDGLLADTGNQTFKQWADQWLTIKSTQVRPQTLTAYQGYLTRWAYQTPLAHKKLANIKPKDIEAVYTHMRAHGIKEATVHHMHRIFNICFKAAITNDLIARNPMDRVTKPQIETYEPTVLTPEKARAMVAALAQDKEHGASLTLNLVLGPRQGERLGLCWDDIDFTKGTLKIERTVVQVPWAHGCEQDAGGKPSCGKVHAMRCPQAKNGGFRMGPPKNKAGVRVAPLPKPLLEMLREHRKAQRQHHLLAGQKWTGAVDIDGKTWDLVFTNAKGGLLRPNQDWRIWHEFTTAQGVEGMRVHDARHTAATVLLAMGVSPQVTMNIMGWSSPSMLARYQHVLDEMKKDAVDRVTDALFG